MTPRTLEDIQTIAEASASDIANIPSHDEIMEWYQSRKAFLSMNAIAETLGHDPSSFRKIINGATTPKGAPYRANDLLLWKMYHLSLLIGQTSYSKPRRSAIKTP